ARRPRRGSSQVAPAAVCEEGRRFKTPTVLVNEKSSTLSLQPCAAATSTALLPSSTQTSLSEPTTLSHLRAAARSVVRGTGPRGRSPSQRLWDPHNLRS